MPVEMGAAGAVTEELHVWETGGAASPEALSAWVAARLAAHEAALAALLAVVGPRTPANSLRLYDAALEQLAAIALNARRNAQRNPKAIMRGDLTLDDYLSSKMISDPLCLFDCDLAVDACTAVVIKPSGAPGISSMTAASTTIAV